MAATVQPDVTLFLDNEGVIREVAFSNALAGEASQPWIGRRWTETVADAGTAKVERLVADARARRVSAFRQVPQRFPSGIELLMEYTAVRLGPRAGLVAVGKNLQAVAALQASVVAAQQSIERDYWRLRNVETRYRLLFNASAEASILVEASSLRVLEANAAALQVLRPGADAPEPIDGREIADEFLMEDREGLLGMLHRVREHGNAPAMLLRLSSDSAPVTVRASLLKSDPTAVFLLQLSAVGRPALRAKPETLSVDALMERHPYGFVVLRRDGSIARGNRAFLELVQIGAEAWAAGKRVEHWLDGAEDRFAAMLEQARTTGAGGSLYATLRGQMGREVEVEVTASAAAGEEGLIGVLLRPSPAPSAGAGWDAPFAVIAAKFGRTTLDRSMKDMARVIEAQCFAKALELRHGDEEAAAGILGLSLRSFQSRLKAFAIDRAGEPDRPAAGA
jgi:transcriptional regulator PpsR